MKEKGHNNYYKFRKSKILILFNPKEKFFKTGSSKSTAKASLGLVLHAYQYQLPFYI